MSSRQRRRRCALLLGPLVLVTVLGLIGPALDPHYDAPQPRAGHTKPKAPEEAPKPEPPPKPKEVDRSSMAYIMSQEFVKKRLVSPGSAKFPWFDRTVMKTGPDRYVVRGYCDSQNKFGALLRTDYVCQMEYLGDDKWQCSELTLLPH